MRSAASDGTVERVSTFRRSGRADGMRITAKVRNGEGTHQTTVSTDGAAKSVAIPPREAGYGSSVNGGELLFLALATCYCNDIYRESKHRGIAVSDVEVTVEGEFGGPGDPARNVTYRAKVVADATEEEIESLMAHTDTVAEIQNSLRVAIPVRLESPIAVSTRGDAG